MTLLNFHGSSVPFLPDSTEFFQSGQLFLSGSNEQRLGAATSYQRSDPINTGGCKKTHSTRLSAGEIQHKCVSLQIWAAGLQLNLCLVLTSAPIHVSPTSGSHSMLSQLTQLLFGALLYFSSCKISCGSS